MRSGFIAVMLVAALVFVARPSFGEEADVHELMVQIQDMKAKMDSQERELTNLKSRVGTESSAGKSAAGALGRSTALSVVTDGEHKRAVRIGGYLDLAYNYDFNTPSDHNFTTGRLFDRESNGFDVNLVQVTLDGHATKIGEAGFVVDLTFGANSDLFLAPDDSTVSHVGQAYVEYIAAVGNGLRMVAGKFYTPAGFETVHAQDNWNSSRSFNANFLLPLDHTGAGVEYNIGDQWGKIYGYITNGWNNVPDNNNSKTGVVGMKSNPFVDWFHVSSTYFIGNEEFPGHPRITYPYVLGYPYTLGYPYQINNYLNEKHTTFAGNTNLKFTPWEHLSFALDFNTGMAEDADVIRTLRDPMSSPKDAKWFGVAGYVKYEFCRKWYVAGRGEYLDDMDGYRLQGFITPNAKTGLAEAAKLYSGTLTLSYTVAVPLEMRLEYRHDAANHNIYEDNANKGAYKKNQDTIGFNWLYKF